MGLATIRVDGFASLGGGFDGGHVTTKPIVLDGAALKINAKADWHGSVLTEVLDEHSQPLSGYSADDCVPMTEDRVDAEVRWKGESSVGELAGRPVRLRFHLRNAQLFSYQVT